jgi:hypothetical protein
MAIAVLFRRDMDLKPTFMQILVTMMTFDFLCIFFNLLVFCLPVLSNEYKDGVAPYIIPYILPMAQIALTGTLFCTFLLDIILKWEFLPIPRIVNCFFYNHKKGSFSEALFLCLFHCPCYLLS